MSTKPIAATENDFEETRFEGFALPTSNTTYTPNQFFDVCLPNSSRGTIRLVAYLIRKTLGWSDAHGRPQAEQHAVSFNELERKAHINRDMIGASVQEAIEGNFVRRVKLGRPNFSGTAARSAVYELCWHDTHEYIKDPKRFRGFFAGEGNRTYIPNQFFDVLVPNETLAVTKVVGAVIRYSIGFQTKWGHRRQVIDLSYQGIQNFAHIRNRGTVSQAISTALKRNYLQRVEEGFFDRDAGRRSRRAIYAVKWLNGVADLLDGRKNVPGNVEDAGGSENRTGNGRKNVPDQRSEKRTDIQITDTNNTLKQQPHAVAIERLQAIGFDAKAAQAIASKFDEVRILRQIGWIDQRRVKRNRLGMLRAAIEQDWSAPGSGSGRLSIPTTLARSSGASFNGALEATKKRLLDSTPTSIKSRS